MQFIEMTGKKLIEVVSDQEDAPTPEQLADVGVVDDSIIRVNRQGDIELRRPHGWDIIGGLIGEYDHRLRRMTGIEWA